MRVVSIHMKIGLVMWVSSWLPIWPIELGWALFGTSYLAMSYGVWEAMR